MSRVFITHITGPNLDIGREYCALANQMGTRLYFLVVNIYKWSKVETTIWFIPTSFFEHDLFRCKHDFGNVIVYKAISKIENTVGMYKNGKVHFDSLWFGSCADTLPMVQKDAHKTLWFGKMYRWIPFHLF